MRKAYKLLIVVLIAIIIIAGIYMKGNTNASNDRVMLETNKGNIVIELYAEMPVTAGNFKKLVSEGFYDNVIFHRVIEGFMIQGGDPTGTGMGGPGYNIKDEFTRSEFDKNLRGTIAMANAGPNTGGSQFFINLVSNNLMPSISCSELEVTLTIFLLIETFPSPSKYPLSSPATNASSALYTKSGTCFEAEPLSQIFFIIL